MYLCTVETKRCDYVFNFNVNTYLLFNLTEAVVKHPQLFFKKKFLKDLVIQIKVVNTKIKAKNIIKQLQIQ